MSINVRNMYPDGGHTDVCFDDSGKYILTFGKDGDVRVSDGFDDIDSLSYSLYDAGFAICSRGSLFFAGGANQRVEAHKIIDGEDAESVVATFGGEATCLSANKDGSLIVAGSADFNIRLMRLDPGTSTVLETQIFLGHRAPLLSVALDPQGKFFASSAAYNDGTIVVFHIPSLKSVNVLRHPKQNRICAMEWHPKVGVASLAYADDKGNVALAENVYNPALLKTLQGSAPSTNGLAKKNQAPPPSVALEDSKVSDWIKASTKKSAPPPAKSVLSDSDKTDSHVASEILLEDEDEIFQDDDMMSEPGMPGQARVLTRKPDRHTDRQTNRQTNKQPQEAFQPGATPSYWRENFMVWNEFGYMKAYQEEEDEEEEQGGEGTGGGKRGIDVFFHDSSFHHTVHVSNVDHFTLGTLNNHGFLLATQQTNKQTNTPTDRHIDTHSDRHSGGGGSSKVQFNLIGGSDKENWTLKFEKGEWVEGIALGEEWCYVVTSRRLLRIITFSGYQQFILDIPGPLVAVAARQKLFMVVYHQADPTLSGDQCLGFSMYCMGKRRVELIVADERLPLSPQTTMSWAGFGARGTPTTADSSGMVRMFHYRHPLVKIWSPSLDMAALKKNKNDHYFIYAVDEDARHVKAFLCRGSRWPMTLPLPTVCLLPFTTLQAGGSSEVNAREAKCTLHRLFPKKDDRQLRECRADILRLFAVYCEADNDSRARDIAQLMPSASDMEGCWKYATRCGKSSLARQLEALIMAVKKDEEDEEDALIGRPASPVLFENSQPSAATLDDPLGRSMQAVRRPVSRRPAVSQAFTPRTERTERSERVERTELSRLTTRTTANEEEEEEDEGEGEGNVGRLTKRLTRTYGEGEGDVSHRRKAINDLNSKPQGAVSGNKTNGFSVKQASSRSVTVDEDEDESNQSSLQAEEEDPSLVWEPSTTMLNEPSEPSHPTAETLLLDAEPEPEPEPETSRLTSSSGKNPFSKKTGEAPPLLRGISTMEEVTKSRVENLAKSVGSNPKSVGLEPAGKRKPNPKPAGSEPPAKRKPKPVGSEPSAKRGRPKAGTKPNENEEIPEKKEEKKTNSAFSFKKFGWKVKEKEAEPASSVEGGEKGGDMET